MIEVGLDDRDFESQKNMSKAKVKTYRVKFIIACLNDDVLQKDLFENTFESLNNPSTDGKPCQKIMSTFLDAKSLSNVFSPLT